MESVTVNLVKLMGFIITMEINAWVYQRGIVYVRVIKIGRSNLNVGCTFLIPF